MRESISLPSVKLLCKGLFISISVIGPHLYSILSCIGSCVRVGGGGCVACIFMRSDGLRRHLLSFDRSGGIIRVGDGGVDWWRAAECEKTFSIIITIIGCRVSLGVEI